MKDGGWNTSSVIGYIYIPLEFLLDNLFIEFTETITLLLFSNIK